MAFVRIWAIRRAPDRPALLEARPYRFDFDGQEWFPAAARLLADSFIAARNLLPRGMRWERTDGVDGIDAVEWWVA